MLLEPSFEKCDGGVEVAPKHPQQIDVVEVFMAGKAMGQVVFRIDVNEHFAAVRAEEDEAAITDFRRRSLAPECPEPNCDRTCSRISGVEFWMGL